MLKAEVVMAAVQVNKDGISDAQRVDFVIGQVMAIVRKLDKAQTLCLIDKL